jgi:hypothetical protein
MIVYASNAWNFGDFFDYSPPGNSVHDVARKMDNPTLLLINDGGHLARRRR